MKHRSLIVSLLVLLLVLAGCSGVTESTPSLEDRPFPTGYDENGVTNATVALATHNSSLAGTGVRVQHAVERNGNWTNTTYESSVRSDTVLLTCEAGCGPANTDSSLDIYIQTGRVYQQHTVDGRLVDTTTRRTSLDHGALHNATVAGGFGQYIPTRSASTVDVVTRDNRTHYRYQYSNTTVLVQENGVIETLEVDRPDEHVRIYVRPSPGLTLDKPDWATKLDDDRYDGGYGGYGDDDTASSGCGTNDGDQSYDEDNDRDNDGLCDE